MTLAPIPPIDYTVWVERHEPPLYLGGADPTNLDGWIREWEQVFERILCPDELRVQLATPYLAEESLHWWGQCAEDLIRIWDFD